MSRNTIVGWRRVRAPETEEREVDLVATWFARIGSVAVMVGAGFGFKYAVDQGVIGPTGRVAIGLMVSAAFVVWGEWARARTWHRLSQAVTAAGLVLGSLSVWAASQLYDLIEPDAAFGALVAIIAAGVVQALRHDAIAIGVLSAIGGFVAPLLSGFDRATPSAVMVYILLLDTGLLALALGKRWWPLGYIAVTGSVAVFVEGADPAQPVEAVAYAAVMFGVFALGPILRAWLADGRSDEYEVPLSPLAATAAFAAGMWLLEGSTRGDFTALLGLGALGLAVAAHVAGDDDHRTALIVVGSIFLVVAVPLRFEGPWLPTMWAAQGAAVSVAARRWFPVHAPVVGLTLVISSLVVSLSTTADAGFEPERLLASALGFSYAMQVAALVVIGWSARRHGRDWERDVAPLATGSANVLALLWLSLEAAAAVARADVADPAQASSFALSATWVVYATGLVVAGMSRRVRAARIAGLALFATVIVKLAIADAWTLSTSYRFVAFTGLGAVLLGISVLYHRVRELIEPDPVEEREETQW